MGGAIKARGKPNTKCFLARDKMLRVVDAMVYFWCTDIVKYLQTVLSLGTRKGIRLVGSALVDCIPQGVMKEA